MEGVTQILRQRFALSAVLALLGLLACDRGLFDPGEQGTSPEAPADLVIESTSHDALELSWEDRADNKTGYRVERRRGAHGEVVENAQLLPPGSREFRDDQLDADTLYSYRVLAVRHSASSEPITGQQWTRPTIPFGVQIEADSEAALRLSWQDPNSNTVDFLLRYVEAPATREDANEAPDGPLEAQDRLAVVDGLEADTLYTLFLAARNPGGESEWVEISERTALAPPVALEARTQGPDAIELRWVDTTNSSHTGYSIKAYGVDSEISLSGATVPASIRLWLFSDLEPDARYRFELVAVQGDTRSSLRVSVEGETSFLPRLSWTDPPHIDSSCRLQVPGDSELDVTHGASFASAEGLFNVLNSIQSETFFYATQASKQGLSTATLLASPSDADRPLDIEATWIVLDSLGGQSSTQTTFGLRFVSLPAPPPLLPTRQPDGDAMAGRQAGSSADYAIRPCASCGGLRGSLALGHGHSCVLDDAGSAYCWGGNDRGQLGSGEIGVVSRAPRRVCATGQAERCIDGAPLLNVRALAAGHSSTCALLDSGELHCWGRNAQGLLGQGDDQGLSCGSSDVCRLDSGPVCASGALSTGDCVPLAGVVAAAVGTAHACALSSTGQVWCWGANDLEQLGLGGGGPALSANPVRVCASGSGVGCTGGQALGEVRAIAAADTHSCALLASGGVHCWGNDRFGQLGDGSAASWTDAVAVATGASHSCALLGSGELRCWGDNARGQLGDGSLMPSTYPVAVCEGSSGPGCSGGPHLTGVRAVATGAEFTCALLADATLRCWGANDRSQLGTASQLDVASPMTVCATCDHLNCTLNDACTDGPSLGGVVAIEAGREHACALLQTGELRCWGFGLVGQIGDATDVKRPEPAVVCFSRSGEGICDRRLDSAAVWSCAEPELVP